MAAARINLPAALVTAGPCYDEIKPSESKELRARFLAGEATEREVIEGTLKYYTGPGVCPFLGTANTMLQQGKLVAFVSGVLPDHRVDEGCGIVSEQLEQLFPET